MSPAYLRERLRYDPETGKLFWRHYEPYGDRFNARWAGREAFTAISSRGYRHGRIDGVDFLAHRVIWAMAYNAWPGDEIDHDDRDKGNQLLSNLSEADRVGNQRNHPLSRANTSGVTGVVWNSSRQRWQAQIGVGGTTLFLGRFDDLDAATAARRAAEREHGFHPNHGSAR